MILVVTCALVATAGVGLVVWSVLPRRPCLAAELDELMATGPVVAPAGVGLWESFGAQLWDIVDPGADRFALLKTDLAVTGDTPGMFARQVVTTAVLFAGLALGLCAVVAVEGFHLGPGLGVVLVALMAALGAAVPRGTVRSEAEGRRAEMRDAVAVICDLSAVLVAAGEDVDAALVTAVGAGQGWAFDEVRASLPRSSRLGTWSSLEGLGERLGVAELVVLAQNMGLAQEKGAKIRDALNTQARTLREEAATEVEARAGSATERMSFPMVALLAGFLLVIGYPAIARL